MNKKLYAIMVTTKDASYLLAGDAFGARIFFSPEEAVAHAELVFGQKNPHLTCQAVKIGETL